MNRPRPNRKPRSEFVRGHETRLSLPVVQWLVIPNQLSREESAVKQPIKGRKADSSMLEHPRNDNVLETRRHTNRLDRDWYQVMLLCLPLSLARRSCLRFASGTGGAARP